MHPGTGVPLLPTAGTVASAGSGVPHVPNESSVPITDSHGDPAVLQQVVPEPWGQDAAKRASSFRPGSVEWRKEYNDVRGR